MTHRRKAQKTRSRFRAGSAKTAETIRRCRSLDNGEQKKPLVAAGGSGGGAGAPPQGNGRAEKILQPIVENVVPWKKRADKGKSRS